MDIIEDFYKNKTDSAAAMAAYMKDNFSFLGIKKPKRNEIMKPFLKEAKAAKQIDWDFIFKCWDLPEREFQYLALDYLATFKNKLKKDDINNIRQLIINKSWWDTVDLLASNIIGDICLRFPSLVEEHVFKWSFSDNMWLSRTAILFQLKYKEKTDRNLLSEIIKMNNGSKEFFINKAIGWALREYSKTNREWVREFIGSESLSSLSVREGSKYI